MIRALRDPGHSVIRTLRDPGLSSRRLLIAARPGIRLALRADEGFGPWNHALRLLGISIQVGIHASLVSILAVRKGCLEPPGVSVLTGTDGRLPRLDSLT